MASIEDRWYTDGDQPKDRCGKGLRYRVHYTDPSKRQRSKSFPKITQARNFLSTTEADLLRGDWTDPDGARTTLRDQAASRLTAYHPDSVRRENMAYHLGTHILPALGDHTLGQLAARPSILTAFLAGLDLSDGSVHQVYVTLSQVLAAAVEDGLIGKNPALVKSVRVTKPPPRKVIPWTGGQVAAVRAALPECWRCVADLGSELGLRAGEIFGAGPDEADFLKLTFHVRRQVKRAVGRWWFSAPKGGRERDVPMTEPFSHSLSARIAAYEPVPLTLPWHEPGNRRRHGKPVTVLVFFARDGAPVDSRNFRAGTWHRALKAAQLAGHPGGEGLHVMRHYFASALLAGGKVGPREVSEYLGHHDPGFTLRVYGHLMPGREAQTRRAIEEALRPPAQEAIFPGVAQGDPGAR